MASANCSSVERTGSRNRMPTPGTLPSARASASPSAWLTVPEVTRRWPFGVMITWRTVPTGSGGDSRTNMPYGEMSCDTARMRFPSVISSTGKFIATRALRRRTVLPRLAMLA